MEGSGMAGPLGHLGALARARATRRSRERADRQALSELEERPLALPAGLEVEWLGVSGYRLSYEGHTLFIDPYLSRAPFRDLLLRRTAIPDPAALDNVQLSELFEEIAAVGRDLELAAIPRSDLR